MTTYYVLMATKTHDNVPYYCCIAVTDNVVSKSIWMPNLLRRYTNFFSVGEAVSLDHFISMMPHYYVHILATTHDLSTLHESNPELFI